MLSIWRGKNEKNVTLLLAILGEFHIMGIWVMAARLTSLQMELQLISIVSISACLEEMADLAVMLPMDFCQK